MIHKPANFADQYITIQIDKPGWDFRTHSTFKEFSFGRYSESKLEKVKAIFQKMNFRAAYVERQPGVYSQAFNLNFMSSEDWQTLGVTS